MNLINGIAVCFLCGEQFDLGHHYDYHMSQCLSKKRFYIQMPKAEKRRIVEQFEAAMAVYMPGVLIG